MMMIYLFEYNNLFAHQKLSGIIQSTEVALFNYKPDRAIFYLIQIVLSKFY